MAKEKIEKAIVIKGMDDSPAAMIRSAIIGKADLDKLEKLLVLQERFEQGEAKKAYVKALSAFKCEVPDIKRDKKNKQYDSTYVSKGNLIKTITPILSKFGLSANFAYKNLPDKSVEVVCRLTHQQGHSEEISFSAPADVSGSKNPIQQLKSTITYLEKITFAGILGIESLEEIDDDGKIAGIELIGNKELNFIRDNLIDLNLPEAGFVKYMKLEKLEDMPKSDYQKAVVAIEAKRKQKASKE